MSVASQAVLRERVERSDAHFDARVFALPSLELLCAYMRWRALHDCRRNSISMLAQVHFAPAELHKVSSNAALEMLDRKGVRWEDTLPFFRFGTYVKKEGFLKTGFNPKTKVEVVAHRLRPSARSFEFVEPEAASFLLERVWPGDGPGPGLGTAKTES